MPALLAKLKHSEKVHACNYCRAAFSYAAEEVEYDYRGVGRVRCPECKAMVVTGHNPFMSNEPGKFDKMPADVHVG